MLLTYLQVFFVEGDTGVAHPADLGATESRAAPQVQCRLVTANRAGIVATGSGAAGLVDQPAELQQIEVLGGQGSTVSVRVGGDGETADEPPAEPGDASLELVAGTWWGLIGPRRLDQLLGQDGPVGVQ